MILEEAIKISEVLTRFEEEDRSCLPAARQGNTYLIVYKYQGKLCHGTWSKNSTTIKDVRIGNSILQNNNWEPLG